MYADTTKIDMTPANILAETSAQVVKILKSPGCRYVFVTACWSLRSYVHRKNPVFVKSPEVAVEVATSFGKDRSDLYLFS
jgi:hypothetical protein